MGEMVRGASQKLGEVLEVCREYQKKNEELRQMVIKAVDDTDRIRILERRILLTPNMN